MAKAKDKSGFSNFLKVFYRNKNSASRETLQRCNLSKESLAGPLNILETLPIKLKGGFLRKMVRN